MILRQVSPGVNPTSIYSKINKCDERRPRASLDSKNIWTKPRRLQISPMPFLMSVHESVSRVDRAADLTGIWSNCAVTRERIMKRDTGVCLLFFVVNVSIAAMTLSSLKLDVPGRSRFRKHESQWARWAVWWKRRRGE